MVLVTWRQPKLTNNYLKWQKILRCKKLMNEEWKVIVLTPVSSHKCASRRKQNITSWPVPLASLPSYIYRPVLFPSSHHYLGLCLPPFPSLQKAPWMSFVIFWNYLKSICFNLDWLSHFCMAAHVTLLCKYPKTSTTTKHNLCINWQTLSWNEVHNAIAQPRFYYVIDKWIGYSNSFYWIALTM